MKTECCHQHPDNGDLATQTEAQTEAQTEETDLRAVNDKLLATLEKAAKRIEILLVREDNSQHPWVVAVRDAIEEAKK